MKNKTLSDKWMESFGTLWHKQEDVKQFISDLKEVLDSQIPSKGMEILNKEIDKLAGEELVKKKGCGKEIGWHYKDNEKDKPIYCGEIINKQPELCPKCEAGR